MRSDDLPRRRFLQLASAVPLASYAHSRHGRPVEAQAASSLAPQTMRVPGFVDLQVNGFAGVDFNDPASTADDVTRALAAMRATGVTRCLPTLITASLDQFRVCARTIARHPNPDAAIAGLHIEGPYISPADGFRGAHPREHVIDASIDDFARRQEAAEGRIKIVTLAPESPGAIALIEHLIGRGIRVAIGHTNASPDQIRDAIRAGATLSTHLGNGCAAMLPRHPNVIWEQLGADALTASLIVDGHHLPPATVKSMIRAKTPARTILVTDATAAAGRPPGSYMLGTLRVELSADGRVAAPGATNLAGSALSLDRAIGNTVRFTGLPLTDVLPMATATPAAYLGITPAGEIEAEWHAEACTLRILRVTP